MSITVTLLGDIVGRSGREAVIAALPSLRSGSDLIVVNGENAAGGRGLDRGCARELLAAGIDGITTGDHVWTFKDLDEYLRQSPPRVIRPANYPPGALGQGWMSFSVRGVTIAVMNLMGRTFIDGALDCPFRIFTTLRKQIPSDAVVVVDFHAEASSEKVAFARHVVGQAALVVGTHTHVQTFDPQILPNGTGFLSDLGMCGPIASVIGMAPEVALTRFINGTSAPYKVAEGPAVVSGVRATIDEASRRTTELTLIRLVAGTPAGLTVRAAD